MPAEIVLAALQALLQALSKLKTSYALAGGLALAVWKYPRFTKDVDVVVALGPMSKEELVDSLQEDGFFLKQRGLRRIGDFEIVQLIYDPPGALVEVQVDLLVATNTYQQRALERRQRVSFPDIRLDVDVLSCEDVILYKLMAGRIIDRADAANLLRINRDLLDVGYLAGCISEHGLSEEFAQAWREAFPGEPLPD